MRQYSDSVTDSGSQGISGATVTVYNQGTSTKSTLYSDDGVTTTANPVTTAANGSYSFYIADGTYDFVIAKTGYETVYLDNIVVEQSALERLASTSTVSDGDALVACKRTDTGAVAFTLHEYNENRIPNPKVDFGAVGDAVSNDTTAVQSTFTTLYGELTKSTGYLVSSLTSAATSFIRGLGRLSPIKFSSTGGLQITGSYVHLESIRIDGQTTTQSLYAATGASNANLRNLDITTSDAASGYLGIQNNASGTDRWSLLGNRIVTNSYAFLVNETAGGSKGLVVAGNFLDSRVSDAIEINTPTTKFEDAAIVGNILRSQNVGAAAASGFAFGTAHSDGIALVGNVSQESRQQSFHIEDGSENIAIVGNVAKLCRESGIKVVKGGTGANSADSRPVSIVGNQFEAASAVAGEAGIYIVYDADGTQKSCPIIGNVIRGFESGLWLGGDGMHIADGNTIHDATYAIRCESGGAAYTKIEGTNFVNNCTTLLYGSSSTAHMIQAGKFVCENKPTNIIAKNGSTTRPGCSVSGFAWPQTQVLTAGVATYAIICPSTSTRFAGKITIEARNAAGATDNTWYSADISFDGTTLTITNPISEYNGGLAMTGTALRINAGNLEAGFFHASAITVRLNINFDGIYMV